MDKDEIITIDGKWKTGEEHAVADIFEEALARVRERGTSEEAIQEHLQNMLGASISRANPSVSEAEQAYREVLVCMQCLSGAGYTPDTLAPALIRHAVELAAMCLDFDTPQEVRGMLTKSLDKYLFLNGVPRPSAPILRLVSPERCQS
jgi:hypothetical protein